VDIIANGGTDGAHLDELAEEELPPVACRGGGGRGRRLAPPLSSRAARHCGARLRGRVGGIGRVQCEVARDTGSNPREANEGAGVESEERRGGFLTCLMLGGGAAAVYYALIMD